MEVPFPYGIAISPVLWLLDMVNKGYMISQCACYGVPTRRVEAEREGRKFFDKH
jgi:hypothetical protein